MVKLKSETYNGHLITFEKNARGVRAYANELGETYFNSKKEGLADYKSAFDIWEDEVKKPKTSFRILDWDFTLVESKGKYKVINTEYIFWDNSKERGVMEWINTIKKKRYNSLKDAKKDLTSEVNEFWYGK